MHNRTFLKTIFRKNGYPENFIDKCFKTFLDNIHLVKEKVPIVERKRLLLVLPYLGVIPLQTRTKLQQAIKGVLNCCKLEIAFKCQTKLSNSFPFDDPIPKDLISGVVYKFQCGLCNESYQTLRFKIWGAHRCVTFYWKEGQTNQEQCCL